MSQADITATAAPASAQQEFFQQSSNEIVAGIRQIAEAQGSAVSAVHKLLEQALGQLRVANEPTPAIGVFGPQSAWIERALQGILGTASELMNTSYAATNLGGRLDGEVAENMGIGWLTEEAFVRASNLEDELKKLYEQVKAERTMPVDPHLAWAQQVAEIRAEDSYDNDQDEVARQCQVIWDLHKQMAATPARTPAGIAEQIKIVIDCQEGGSAPAETELAALKAAVASLEAMSVPLRPQQN